MKNGLLLLLLLTLSVGVQAQDAKSSKKVAIISQEPSIYIESDVINYGTIKKGADPIRKLKITNKGAQPLLLLNCEGSCSCTVPTCPREPIMPGKSVDVNIKYDTNKVGEINKSVTIISNDPQHKVKVIRVKGLIQ